MTAINDNEIILDVFELKNYNPVLKYRIVVYDGIILSVNNSGIKNGVSKMINNVVKEEFVISELTKFEKLDFSNSLTHRFEIKKLGWKNLFLNLTDKDLINLGFKEKPKSFWEKLFNFTTKGIWIWLERIGIVLTIVVSLILLRQCYDGNKKEKPSTGQETLSNQTDSIINSKDAINISKTD